MNHSEEFNNEVQTWCDEYDASVEYNLVDNGIDPPIMVWKVNLGNKWCDFGVEPEDPDYEKRVLDNLYSIVV